MYIDPRFLQRPPSFTQAQIGRALLLGDRAGADRVWQANMLANQPQTIKLNDGRIIHYLPNDPTQQWQEAAPLKIDTLKPGEYAQGTRPNASGGFDIVEGGLTPLISSKLRRIKSSRPRARERTWPTRALTSSDPLFAQVCIA
jgi:hypothetical protein